MEVYKARGGMELFVGLTAEGNYRAFSKCPGSPPSIFGGLKPYATRGEAERSLRYYCERLHKKEYMKAGA